ncbi:hypothetical protein N7449_005522 [Penicillium cf. viridicatum]|uniref:Uncharacterized protein n=1 Tax=Penicillium cf. viridicatum TaxID=2972119 RepID=A0A9W9MLE9_9EURO|nr:hypothetical protein N7449_005522 [Penicillium cf. viridicatum]
MRFTTVLSSLFVLATLGLAAPIAEPTPDVVARDEVAARGSLGYCYIKRGTDGTDAADLVWYETYHSFLVTHTDSTFSS